MRKKRKSKNKSKYNKKRIPMLYITSVCFSCDEAPIKYVDGLCESCHTLAIEAL